MLLVTDKKELENMCSLLMSENIISIDTEFSRRTTYYAKLSIVQIKSKNHRIIIDVLSVANHLQPFQDLLLNNKILKILHSPREDFEIFYNLFGALPQNIFDTQIAAEICGLGSYLSYSDLCKKICNVEIDKSYQKADWMQRPLTPQMLCYAISDVEYLERIHSILWQIIQNQQLQKDLDYQITKLLSVSNYKTNPEEAWRKLKCSKSFFADFTDRIKLFTAFREKCAMDIDIPRQHFIHDTDLISICQHLPQTSEELKRLNLDSSYLKQNKYKNMLLELSTGFSENLQSIQLT